MTSTSALDRLTKIKNGAIKKKNCDQKLLSRLPLEIQETIIERVPIIHVAHKLSTRWRRHRQRMDRVFRDSRLSMKYGQKTRRMNEFTKFIEQLPDLVVFNELTEKRRFASDVLPEISGQPFNLDGVLPDTEILFQSRDCVLEFKLRQPTNDEKVYQMEARVNVEITHPGNRERAVIKFNLGNFDDKYIMENEKNYRCSVGFPLEEGTTPKIAFDDHNTVYYTAGDWVCRKALTADHEPEHLFELRGHIYGIVAGGNKLFVLYKIPGTTDVLMCYDTNTKQVWETKQVCGYGNMAAHGNTVVICSDCYNIQIYTLGEKGLEWRSRECFRKQRLNRHTYLMVVCLGDNTFALKTLSIVDDELVEHFVQYTSECCVFSRYTDNTFYVLEEDRRSIWFQECPGDAPYLLHSDITRTTIIPEWNKIKFQTERTVKRRKSL